MTEELKTEFKGVPGTLPAYCRHSFERHARPDALNYKKNSAWIRISGAEANSRIERIALGLDDLGLRAGDKVAIISENRPEWSLTDLAVLSLGAVTVPIYTTQAVDQIRYILEDSSSGSLIVSGARLWKHCEEAVRSVERLERLIFLDDDSLPENDKRAISLSTLESTGDRLEEREPDRFQRLLGRVSPEDLATIIYTSGTTGEPKGVMLTHGNFTSNIDSISRGLPIRSNDRSLSVLPLSHIFERTVFYVLCANGVAVHYCSAFEKLAAHLQEVRPTIMTAVPRLFEQVYHKIVKKGRAAGGIKTRLFNWSLDVGQQYWERIDRKRFISPVLKARHSLASRLVFSKWRAAVGGDLRFFVSGGAPLSKKLSYAFWAAGIPILQGYGMTEACIVSANRPEDNKIGSIGRPFHGIKMTVSETDGELLIRGENVMRGYLNKPDESAKVLDEQGWYHTGDVGYEDEEGHFYITDRIKDLFKLSNGKYVAPQQVESLLKQSPLVAQAVVVGSGRKQVGALVVPDWETLKQTLRDENIEAGGSREELCENRYVIKRVQNDAIRFTKETNDYERVKRVYLLPREFSIEKGEMTPTLKIKRGVVDRVFAEAIDEICGV